MRGLILAIVVLVIIALAFAGLLIATNLDPIGRAVSDVLFLVSNGVDPASVVHCSTNTACSIAHAIIYSLVFVFVVLTGFAYTTLLERRVISFIQQRVGPNRVGPLGFLQPLADAIKLIFKEDVIPSKVDKPVYYLAPMLKVVPTLLVMAVIPLGPDILIPWFDGTWYIVPLGLADVNVGILWLLAITSIATYGVVLAGWSSNNKYASLGAIRASAQMISYELSLGLAIAVPVIIVGSMSIGDIIDAQRNIWEWFVFQNPLAAGVLLVALFAEVNRGPFDLPEAEQELTAGYMTEYSGMKFALFMMAEYLGMIGVSMIAASLFFGGYHLIPVDLVPIAGPLNMTLKVVFFLFLFIWVRGTLPRIRYDRLMSFGWKVLLPVALLAVTWTAIAVVIGEELQSSTAYAVVSGIFFLVVVISGYLILRRSGTMEPIQDEPDLADDPIITGEKRSLGWILIQIVGFLVAIPFAIVQWNIRLFEGLRGVTQPPVDETAIEVADPGTMQQSGGD